MKKIKIILDKTVCIDCGSCVPEIVDKDGNSPLGVDEKDTVHLVNGVAGENGVEEVVIEIEDGRLEEIKESIKICPVGALSIEEL